jgi:hypothetical protein
MINSRIKERIAADGRVRTWLQGLTKYHFVATAQISVEVTDAEGFTPSLDYLNNSGSLTLGLGGQLTGTQDRSLTINYAIDLANLSPANTANYCVPPQDSSGTAALKRLGLTGAISGDLGLADIIADGLIALHTSEDVNVYGSSGPVPPVIVRDIGGSGEIDLPPPPGGKPVIDPKFTIDGLTGILQFAPQSPGASTPGTVSLSGTVTLGHSGLQSTYVVNWSGSTLPQMGNPPNGTVYFSLTGTLTPVPGSDGLAGQTSKIWGYSPTISLTGSIDSTSYGLDTLKLSGILGPAANSQYEKADLITMTLVPPPKPKLAPPVGGGGPGGGPGAAGAGGAGAGVKGGASSPSAAGGTSFGSLIDFVLVYGINGGPNWTFQRFKGPASGGMTPLLSATRTKTDSLAITFVATCQDFDSFSKVPTKFGKYWDSIGACNPTNTIAQQQGASVGYQNNSLMILRNFLVRP